MDNGDNHFHLHLISDATGETLMTVARAATAHYGSVDLVKHVHPAVRNMSQIDRVIEEIGRRPGIVLYTLVDPDLCERIETACVAMGLPCVSIIGPVLTAFRSFLGEPTTSRVGAQHVLDADYFRRIDALNFTMMHDDGQFPEHVNDADIVIVGISRTSKTPTSIYLANRGIKTMNIPIVLGIPLPEKLFEAKDPLIVGLIASPERVAHIRQNRLLALNAADNDTAYVDRSSISEEIAFTRKTCGRYDWPVIDVTRRSIEETAAAINALYQQHRKAREDRKGA
ncbi:MAG: pyruvate, water dikinase regulatory protein [Hyphomicrobiales bacterium]